MNKHNKIKVGVIGAGAIAQELHIPGYFKSQHCELVAIADPCIARFEDLKQKGWEFRNYHSSYKDLLESNTLDVISICAPNKYHREISLACFEKAHDVLLEKPIAMSLTESNEIWSAAEANKCNVMVSFSHRFNQLNISAKKEIENGSIGKPYMIRVRFGHNGPQPGWAKSDWFYNFNVAGGGVIMDMAVHAFDIIHWLVGTANTVYCQLAYNKKLEVEDNALAVLELENDCLGYIDVSWTSPAGFNGIEIMGDKGYICCDYLRNQTVMKKNTSSPNGQLESHEKIICDNPTISAWSNQMEVFISKIMTQEKHSPGIIDGIYTQKVVDAAYKSSELKAKVEI